MASNLFAVVSGLPASGKSTVARILARELGLPLLDKDAYLEALFADSGDGQSQRREQLSRRADAMLRVAALQSAAAVLTSWWRHSGSTINSGTSISWLPSLPGRLVEIHCRCRPEMAVARFLSRKRHPGHRDGRHSESDLVATFLEQAALGPLGVGYLVEVDTEPPLDTAALSAAFRNVVV